IRDGFQQVGRGMRAGTCGVLSGQHHVEKDAERVNVRGCCYRPTCNLFGRGIFGCECRSSLASQESCRAFLPFAFHQLGNAEVEEFYRTAFTYLHIGWLDVAMHNEVRVRVRHCCQHIEEQTNPGSNVEPSLITVAIDGLAFHVFKNEIRLSVSSYTRIEQ